MSKRNPIWVVALALSTLAILSAPSTIAQTQKQDAKNPNEQLMGAKEIDGVDVIIKRKPSGAARTAKTDKNGGFNFKDLTPGIYEVIVNPPALPNAEAKSFFESRSNYRLVIELSPKKTKDPLVVDLVLKGDKLVRVVPESSSNTRQEVIAERPVQSEKESEITIEVADGQSVSGKITGRAAQARAQDKPFVVEYYYKVKWGSTEEFIRLYKKNHYPLLKKQMEEGRILQMKTESPFYHANEEGRWDYRVTIAWKNSVVAHDDYDDSVNSKKLFPDQAGFNREEQRRFELLLGHWDVALVPVDLDKP